MVLFEGLSNLFGGITGGLRPRGAGFPRILLQGDLMTGAITGAAGFVRLGAFTVAAQTQHTWGFGLPNTAETGRIFMDTENALGTDIDGAIRLAAENSQSTAIDIIIDIRSEITSENPTDITKQVFFPEIVNYPALRRIPTEDDLLAAYFNFGTDTDTMSSTESVFRVHSTVYA